jgi:uncharacterized protein YutD
MHLLKFCKLEKHFSNKFKKEKIDFKMVENIKPCFDYGV